MTVAEAIRTRLLSLAPVTALVGTRVRLVKLRPSELFPAIRVQRVDDNEDMHLRGSVGIKMARVQMDSVAKEASGVDAYGSASDVDAAAHGAGDGTALCGFTGTVDGIRIHAIRPAGVREGYDAEEIQQFKIMRDYYVEYSD